MIQKQVKMVFIEAQALHGRTHGRTHAHVDEHQILRSLHNRPFGQQRNGSNCRPNGAFSKSSKYDIEILECTDIYDDDDDLT